MNSITSLTPATLRKAADIQEKIGELKSELANLLGVAASDGNAAPAKKKRKHRMSRAGRAAIAAAARARWAKIKGNSSETKGSRKPKRKFNAAARARLSAAAKQRWAKAKAAGKTGL